MQRQPLLPRRVDQRQEAHLLPGHRPLEGFAVEMGPDAIRLPVGHDHDAVAETELLERIGLAVDDGVEPDPGAAAYSERDENRFAADDVIRYMMKGHHVYRVGAALSVDGQPEHAIIWLEEGHGFSGYDVRVV